MKTYQRQMTGEVIDTYFNPSLWLKSKDKHAYIEIQPEQKPVLKLSETNFKIKTLIIKI